MILSPSVRRRYTPPTCTLEVAAKDSPLSRWAGRPVLKNLRFQLRFDDPRLPEDQQIVIHGDRAQLEALCDVVSDYVQGLLVQSSLEPEAVPRSLHPALARSPWDESGETISLAPDPEPVASSGSEFFLVDGTLTPRGRAEALGLVLAPQGRLSHQLTLGKLAPSAEQAVVTLSLLQLFDLASALDEYTVDVLAMPTLERPAWVQAPPTWLRTAAVVLVTVGLTTGAVKWVDSINSPVATTASSELNAPTANQGPTDFATPPPPPPGSQQPSIALVPKPPATSGQVLPSPGAAGSGTQAGQPLPSVGVPGTSTTVVPAPQQETVVEDPGASVVTGIPVAPIQGGGAAPAEAPAQTQAESPETAIASAPVEPAPPGAEAGAAKLGGDPLADQNAASSLSLGAAPAGEEAAAGMARSAAPQTETAFDTIPQVAEARQYFRQQWSPPAGLSQTLEYRLVLNANGSIQQIVPLGQASETYLDRTAMPLMGEPFVSPVEGDRTPVLRVVLSPNGEVQTFLESP